MSPGIRFQALRLALSALLIGCTCERAGDPCLPWAAEGDTYTVEIVQHIDFGILDGYQFTGHSDRTCGEGFDLGAGDKLTIDAFAGS